MSDNQLYLDQVCDRIGDAVYAFCRNRVGRKFHAEDLQGYVSRHYRGKVSPASADRVLRELRKQGKVAYECVDRAASLYRVTAAGELAAEIAEAAKGMRIQ